MHVVRTIVLVAYFVCELATVVADTERPPISEIQEVRTLPISEAAKGLPFALDAQITHIGVNRSGIFVHQDGVGIYATIKSEVEPITPFKLGSLIHIKGQTHSGSFIPHLMIDEMEVISSPPLPDPLTLTYDNLFSPELDCTWVSLEGFVLGSSVNTPYITLQVETFGSLIDVILENSDESEKNVRQLIHRHIRLRGVAASQANDKRQLTGRNIRVQDFSKIDLTVSRGQIPLVSVDKLLTTQWLYSRFRWKHASQSTRRSKC